MDLMCEGRWMYVGLARQVYSYIEEHVCTQSLAGLYYTVQICLSRILYAVLYRF